MIKRITSRLIFIAIIFLFMYSTYSYGAVNPDFTPQWNVGDSWDMVVRQTSEGAISVGAELDETSVANHTWFSFIHFNVIDYKEIDREMCHVLEITYKNPNNQFEQQAALQLYIRENDFTLKKILEITKGIGTSKQYIDNYHNNGHDFLIFRDSLKIPVLCDFPNFPATNINEERTVRVSNDSYPETQKVSFINPNILKIELSTFERNGSLKTTQIWERGKLWWSSVNRTFTYKDITKPGHPEVTKVEYDSFLVGIDKTPPDLKLNVSPATLWPPNHEMVQIIPAITVTDDNDRYPDVKLESITSNEPDSNNDIQITQDGKIFLRAEREGKGNGRIYTITYSATDASGNKATASATVTVPHDMGDGKNR